MGSYAVDPGEYILGIGPSSDQLKTIRFSWEEEEYEQ